MQNPWCTTCDPSLTQFRCAAVDAAAKQWGGRDIMFAHVVLLLLAILKAVTGALWLLPPMGIIVITCGFIGIEAAVIYLMFRCFFISVDGFLGETFDLGVQVIIVCPRHPFPAFSMTVWLFFLLFCMSIGSCVSACNVHVYQGNGRCAKTSTITWTVVQHCAEIEAE